MASSKEFVEHIVERVQDAGVVTFRKMFGEYGIYCNGKMFALVCDNQFLIKITEAGRKLCPGLEEVSPYEGAKPCFLIEDFDNRELLTRMVLDTCNELPEPKSKTRRKISGKI